MPVLFLVVIVARLQSYGCRYKTARRHGPRTGLRRWPEIRDALHADRDVPGAKTSAGVQEDDGNGSLKSPAPADPPKQAVTVRIVGGCRDKRCAAGLITREIAPGLNVVEDCRTCGALGFRAEITPRTDTPADATGRRGATGDTK